MGIRNEFLLENQSSPNILNILTPDPDQIRRFLQEQKTTQPKGSNLSAEGTSFSSKIQLI